MINVADPDELDGARSRDLRRHRPGAHRVPVPPGGGLPDEEAQYRAYRAHRRMGGPRPVVIRTLDAGGDKPIAGLTIDGESNPFLGRAASACRWRGRRSSASSCARSPAPRRSVTSRSCCRWSTVPSEIAAGAALSSTRRSPSSQAAGVPCRRPPLGIMVEVPAVAIEPELFAEAAFFSIGSNDLTQYVMASARDIAAVAALNDPAQPGRAQPDPAGRARSAGAIGREVSLCGDMGGDPRASAAPDRRGLAHALGGAAACRPRQARHRRRPGEAVSAMDDRPEATASEAAVARYKTILAARHRPRPSGTRQRLAGALGKNRSFVSQITNPAYATPIPARHLETIFEICHFSPEDAAHFLDAYSRGASAARCRSPRRPARCAPIRSICRTSATMRATTSSTARSAISSSA